MKKIIEKIISSDNLTELLKNINKFCEESYMRDNDEECMSLKELVENKTDSTIHTLLAAYLSVCEDGDEVIQSLYEFVTNCSSFAEVDEETTKQITTEEFEAVLDECDEKCRLRECLEKEHKLVVTELSMTGKYMEFEVTHRKDNIAIVLPRVDVDTDIRKYISELLGMALYSVVSTKLPFRYIYETTQVYIKDKFHKGGTNHIFRKHLYSVLEYKEREPMAAPQADDREKKCVIETGFFRRMINEYLKE